MIITISKYYNHYIKSSHYWKSWSASHNLTDSWWILDINLSYFSPLKFIDQMGQVLE